MWHRLQVRVNCRLCPNIRKVVFPELDAQRIRVALKARPYCISLQHVISWRVVRNRAPLCNVLMVQDVSNTLYNIFSLTSTFLQRHTFFLFILCIFSFSVNNPVGKRDKLYIPSCLIPWLARNLYKLWVCRLSFHICGRKSCEAFLFRLILENPRK